MHFNVFFSSKEILFFPRDTQFGGFANRIALREACASRESGIHIDGRGVGQTDGDEDDGFVLVENGLLIGKETTYDRNASQPWDFIFFQALLGLRESTDSGGLAASQAEHSVHLLGQTDGVFYAGTGSLNRFSSDKRG